MKNLKFILPIFIIAISLSSLSSCKKCKGEDPSATIINNGTASASVQIKTSGGNTVNLNNVQPGTSSESGSYAPGEVKFTISISNTDYVETVLMSECFNYEIAIGANNAIVTTAIDRNE